MKTLKFFREITKHIGLIVILFSQISFCQNPAEEIIIYSNGSVFSPIISIEGDANILWVFDDSTTSSSVNPTKNYGDETLKINRLKVTPWHALKGINLGYDASDAGSDSIPLVADQRVSKINNLDLVAPYLELWCSSYNMLDSLNFDNFINLKTIECYKSTKVKRVSLKNTPSLKRLCLEDNDLESLDLSECTGLEDLRAAINNYKDIIFSNSTEELWHICVRDNPKIEDSLLFSNLEVFPAISELWIWNCNQSGAFKLHNTITDKISIVAHDNKYSILDLSGALQKETSWAQVYFENNQLESVNVSGCKQIYKLNLRNNKLSPDSVDKVLRQIDEFGMVNYTDYRSIDLRDNAIPTVTGLLHKANLEARGWTVYVQTGGEIQLSGNGLNLINGDKTPDKLDFTDFDSVKVNVDSTVHVFIIKNTGTTPLQLVGNPSIILIDGINASNFKLVSEPARIIAVGDSTSFQILFSPSDTGLSSATVSISHDDWDNNPFTFNIQGFGVSSDISSIKSLPFTPNKFVLLQNYPNPFNPSTVISYQLPFGSDVTLKIYDVLGNEVATLVNEFKPAGKYETEFSVVHESVRASGVFTKDAYASGIYFYQIRAANFIETKKMLLLK